jgi:hypothetical protein
MVLGWHITPATTALDRIAYYSRSSLRFPIAYTQIVDEQACRALGLTGSLIADGALSLAACGVLTALVSRRLR